MVAIDKLLTAIISSLYYLANGYLLPGAGVVCVGIIVWGGIQYIIGGTKGGEVGKKTITAALVGLIMIVLSYIILNAVVDIAK